MKEEFVAHYVMYLDDFFLEDSIESVYPHVDRIMIARTMRPWFGLPADLSETEASLAGILDRYGDKIDLYSDEFPDEQTQRNFLVGLSRARGHAGAFIVDCDEVFSGNAFPRIYEFLRKWKPGALRVPYLTFVKDAGFCVGPPYEDNLFYVDLGAGPVFTFARKCSAEQTVADIADPEILHFSYLRKCDEDILKKVRSFMHAQDADWEKWFREVYLRFGPGLRDFHPVEPWRWRKVEAFDPRRFPEALRRKLTVHGKLSQDAETGPARAAVTAPARDQGDTRQDPDHRRPLCSIVIPVFNKLDYTTRCYEALRRNTGDVSYEIIFIDNASDDGTPEFISGLDRSVKVIRNEINVGYTKACNQGARAAEGRFVVFLNNDTEPGPAWLGEMVRHAQSDPLIGVVGSKLVYPDGRLQEAGAIVFRDGSGWNVGRRDDPSAPRYNYAREVDYVSGASLLVRRDVLESLGYLDEQFAPGYYEDADLCFGARSLGYRVVYCPFSVVVHHEGVSSGTDLSRGMKRYQVVNREKFALKWGAELAKHYEADPAKVVAASERGTLGNMLVIDPFLPWYDRAAGALRLFAIVSLLKARRYHVTYIARNGEGQQQYARRLRELGVEVYATDPEKMRALGFRVEAADIDLPGILRRRDYDIAYLSFYDIALQYADEIRSCAPRTRIVVDSVDIHFVRERRMAQLRCDKEGAKRAEATRKRELSAYQKADAVVTVTAQDWDHVRQYLPGQRHYVIPTVHAVDEETAEPAGRRGLLFVGNFAHPPNGDAVSFFVREIFPLVRSARPDTLLTIIGNNPPEEVLRMQGEHVRVTGHVPSVEPHLREARVSIAPLRFGAGIKGKIAEAMAAGLPVVTTAIGAEGMDLVNGVQALVEDSPAGFAGAVVRLLDDGELWSRLSAAGKEHARAHYSPQKIGDILSLMISELAAAPVCVERSGIPSRQDARDSALPDTGTGARRRKGLVSIVILTFNQLKYTEECLESIRGHTPETYEIILVDNGSTDGTVRRLRKLVKTDSRCKLIENGRNLGFARGCNQGIRASEGEYVLLLNNDVVVTPHWLSGLIECLESGRETGIVGPMTNNISGLQRLSSVGDASVSGLDAFAQAFRERFRHRRIGSPRVVGFCMLFRRELTDRIGLLDETFGSGNFEDDDFCLRAAIAGYRNMIAGDVFIHHYGSRSFIGNGIDYRAAMTRNRKIFDRKWSGAGIGTREALRILTLRTVEKAEALRWLGKADKAAETLVEGLKQQPREAALIHALAELLMETKEHDRALELLKELPDAGSDTWRALLTGYCCEALGLFDDAEALAEEALAQEGLRAPALNLKGMLAYRKGDRASADSLFRESIESDRGYGEPYANLGVTAWTEGRHEEALGLFERAFMLSPVVADIMTLYHTAVSELGCYGRAEEAFREAAGLYPGHRALCFFLIDALLKQDKHGEAMSQIERALQAFGIDEGILEAALRVREEVGPHCTAGRREGGETLSLCMIVKNEECHLWRCLGSVKGLVDEIVVVDTGSTDRTKEIARVFGARVFEHEWAQDFSAARNEAIARATGDWVLVLDADEVIARQDHEALRAVLRKGKGGPGAWSLVTRNYVNSNEMANWSANEGAYAEEQGQGWFPSTKVRLFRRDGRVRFENPVHELVEPSLRRAGIAATQCPVPVHHYGMLDERARSRKQAAYYELGRRKLEAAGGSVVASFELAVQAAELGRYDEATTLYRSILETPGRLKRDFAAKVYMNLGYALLESGCFGEARSASRTALDYSPGLREAALNCAVAELCEGDPRAAAETLESSVKEMSQYPPAAALHAALCIIAGRQGEGEETLRALETLGYDCRSYLAVQARRLVSAGREQEARRLLEAAANLRGSPDAGSLRRDCLTPGMPIEEPASLAPA